MPLALAPRLLMWTSLALLPMSSLLPSSSGADMGADQRSGRAIRELVQLKSQMRVLTVGALPNSNVLLEPAPESSP